VGTYNQDMARDTSYYVITAASHKRAEPPTPKPPQALQALQAQAYTPMTTYPICDAGRRSEAHLSCPCRHPKHPRHPALVLHLLRICVNLTAGGLSTFSTAGTPLSEKSPECPAAGLGQYDRPFRRSSRTFLILINSPRQAEPGLPHS
jgi:hypothetical protein